MFNGCYYNIVILIYDDFKSKGMLNDIILCDLQEKFDIYLYQIWFIIELLNIEIQIYGFIKCLRMIYL